MFREWELNLPVTEAIFTWTSFSLTDLFGEEPTSCSLLFADFWPLPDAVLLNSGCLGGVCV